MLILLHLQSRLNSMRQKQSDLKEQSPRSRGTGAGVTSAIVISIACMIASASVVSAQEISVTGGNQTLAITTATLGSEPIPVVNAVTSLTYRKQSVTAKVTVSTSCPGQSFMLSVVAISVTKGVAAPAVTLTNGMPGIDFITGIPKTGPATGTATLQYTASATFSQGNSVEEGNDVHTVTYTIMAQ